MLDTPTRKRIDDCRDILVGKLPDPKAQIEQITIAMIYKFMDDMDKEAIELGGKAKFFSDYFIPDPNNHGKKILVEFEKFGWDNLFDAKVTASQMLSLYSEAIAAIDKNPNIPQLFRDIFKNAFLPYRDPETLKLFLKTIGEFEYTHSEKLGDAFEYLLSVMGSQGDAGQFRTPRHIIDFLVAVVDPQKTDNILDPACGTAGFLISAFKHILLKDTKGNKENLNIFQYNNNYDDEKPFNNLGDQLTPDDHKKVIRNFTGYDISPDMVRLSRVNLYLHGFSDPHIFEYDTLTSEDRWNESYDVILANPPFMSPKGGIRPHKKFSLSSNRSEVLFVDYIAEHLNPKGRAGIIVPEGVIFQSGTAYKELRRSLVENYLYAVVSLPSGVFNPYSGVKTSILLMDKELSKTSEEILFVKIDNDGFGLGAQRNAVKGGQLDNAVDVIRSFVESRCIASPYESMAHAVPKAEIAKNGDYNLSGERYKISHVYSTEYELIELGELCNLFGGGTPSKAEEKYWNNGSIKWLSAKHIDGSGKIIGHELITEEALKSSSSNIVPRDSLIFITRVSVGKYAYTTEEFAINQDLTGAVPYDRTRLSVKYLYCIAKKIAEIIDKQAVGIGVRGITRQQLSQIQIPLPPISIQKEIVAEIEGYQKIIDGAKMVVENYKPKIDIDPEWKMVELGEVCEVKGGKRLPKGLQFSEQKTNHPYIRVTDFYNMSVDISSLKYISEEIHFQISRYIIESKDVYISIAGTIGLMGIIPETLNGANLTENAAKLVFDCTILDKRYLAIIGSTPFVQQQIKKLTHAVGVPKLALNRIETIQIPLPPFETQRIIVSRIEKEQELVNASKQLIEIFEQKIKERIGKVWGE